MMHFKVSILFLFVLCLATKDIEVYADISCSAGEMPEGEKSEVVCNFGKDIRSPRQTFMVWKYPLNTTTFDSKLRTEVLNCAWNSDPAAQPPQVCIVGEGYSYNYNHNVISTVTVDIDDVTKDHEGIYECQLVSDHSIPSTRCVLAVARSYNLVCHMKDKYAIACKADDGLIFHNKDIETFQLEIPDDSFGEGGDYVYTRLGDKEKALDTVAIISDTCEYQTTVTVAVLSICLLVMVCVVIILVGFIVYVRCRYSIEKKRCPSVAKPDAGTKEELAKLSMGEEELAELQPATPTTTKLDTVVVTDETDGANQSVSESETSFTEHHDLEQLDKGHGSRPTGQSESTTIQAAPSREHPVLVDENSDTWTVDEVCQWVGQVEGGRFQQHVNCFRKNNVDGKTLLEYFFALSLKTYLGMSSGESGNDRTRLMEQIESLKTAVQGKKERQNRALKETVEASLGMLLGNTK